MFSKCECDNGPFLVMLQVTYSVNKFAFIPVIIGAMGAIPIDLKLNIKDLDLTKMRLQNWGEWFNRRILMVV